LTKLNVLDLISVKDNQVFHHQQRTCTRGQRTGYRLKQVTQNETIRQAALNSQGSHGHITYNYARAEHGMAPRLCDTVRHKKNKCDENPTANQLSLPHGTVTKNKEKLECGPMPNVMVALPNIGGALFSTT